MTSLNKRTVNGKTFWRLRWVAADGRQRERKFNRRLDAQEFSAEVTRSKAKGVAWGERKTFTDLADEYIIASERGRDGKAPLEKSTLAAYRNLLRSFILPRIGLIHIDELERDHLSDLIYWLLANCKTRTTASHAFNLVKAILNWSEARGVIQKSPAHKMNVQTNCREPKVHPKVFSHQEMGRIIACVLRLKTSRDYQQRDQWRRYAPLVLLLATTGVRISEVLGLQWTDFEREFTHFTINRRVEPKRAGFTQQDRIGPPKTANAHRRLGVAETIRPMLEELALHSQSKWLFSSRHGNPLNHSAVYRDCWYPLLEKAKAPRLGMHSLRHNVASLLMADGKYLEAQKMLGHHTAGFTMSQYGHLLDDGTDTFGELSSGILNKFIPNHTGTFSD